MSIYTTPTEVTEYPQYSFTEPRLALTSDFISQNIQNMSEGNYPAYYQNSMPLIRSNMRRGLQQTYFGSGGMGGDNSVISQIRDTGAALGTGPRNTIARENKALYDYAEKEKAIDEYLAKLGVDITAQAAYQMPALSISMAQGPNAQITGGQTYQTNDSSTLLNSLGNLLGNTDTYSNAYSFLNDMFSSDSSSNSYGGYTNTYYEPLTYSDDLWSSYLGY